MTELTTRVAAQFSGVRRRLLRYAQTSIRILRGTLRRFPGGLVIAVLIAALSIPFLASSAPILYGDLVFPVSQPGIAARYTNLWNPFIGDWNLEEIQRLPMRGPIVLFVLLGWIPPAALARILLLSSMLIAGLSMYALVRYVGGRGLNPGTEFGATAGGLFFVFNPWSIDQLVHIGIYLGYALLPALLLMAAYSVRTEQWAGFLGIGLIVFIAFAHPFFLATLTVAILLGGVFVLWTVRPWRRLPRLALQFGASLLIALALSAAWVLPTLAAWSDATPEGRNYIITTLSLGILGERTPPLEALRGVSASIPSFPFTAEPLVSALLFALPILAALSFLFRTRYRTKLFAGSFWLLGMALGSFIPTASPPLHQYLVFDLPFSSSIGWLYRSPSRFLLLSAFAEAFLAGLCLTDFFEPGNFMLRKLSIRPSPRATAVLVVGLLALQGVAIGAGANYYLNSVFIGSRLPNDYFDAGKALAAAGGARGLWLPTPQVSVATWSSGVSVPPFEAASFGPSLAPTTPSSRLFLSFVEDLVRSGRAEHLTKLMDVIDARYVLLTAHRTDVPGIDIDLVDADSNLTLVYQDNSLAIFENRRDLGPVYATQSNILALGGYDLLPSLLAIDTYDPRSQSVFFAADGSSPLSLLRQSKWIVADATSISDVEAALIAPSYSTSPFPFVRDHDPGTRWSRAMVSDPTHGPWHEYLRIFGIRNWDFDGHEGIVFTWSPGIPPDNPALDRSNPVFSVRATGAYSGFRSLATAEELSLTATPERLAVTYRGGGPSTWLIVQSPRFDVAENSWLYIETLVEGLGVSRFHAKMHFFDETGTSLGQKLVFSAPDRTFEPRVLAGTALSPNRTRSAALEMWAEPPEQEASITLLDSTVFDLKESVLPNRFTIAPEVRTSGSHEVFVRYLESREGGRFEIDVGGLSEVVPSRNSVDRFVWHRVGTVTVGATAPPIQIRNLEGLNAIGSIALIPSSGYVTARLDLEAELGRINAGAVLEAEGLSACCIPGLDGVVPAHDGITFFEDSPVVLKVQAPRVGTYYASGRLDGEFRLDIDGQTVQLRSNGTAWAASDAFSVSGTSLPLTLVPVRTRIASYGFESMTPSGWTSDPGPNQTVDVDGGFNSAYSLRATLNESSWGWKKVVSPPIPVRERTSYTLETWVRGERLSEPHVKLAYYDELGRFLGDRYVSSLPSGTFDWTQFQFSFDPAPGAASVRAEFWHGHLTPTPLPNVLWIDNFTIAHNPFLDAIWLVSRPSTPDLVPFPQALLDSQANPPSAILERRDTSSYVASVRSTGPTTLVLAEPFSRYWRARVDETIISSDRAFGIVNSFFIPGDGTREVQIRYSLQDYHQAGLAITGIGVSLVIVFLVWRWWRERTRFRSG